VSELTAGAPNSHAGRHDYSSSGCPGYHRAIAGPEGRLGGSTGPAHTSGPHGLGDADLVAQLTKGGGGVLRAAVSKQKTTPVTVPPLVATAMSSASAIREVHMWAARDLPITRRENHSTTVAKKNQPCPVCRQVMSPTRVESGVVGLKSPRTRSEAAVAPLSTIVVRVLCRPVFAIEPVEANDPSDPFTAEVRALLHGRRCVPGTPVSAV